MPDVFKEIGDVFEKNFEADVFKDEIKKLWRQIGLPNPTLHQIKNLEKLNDVSLIQNHLCFESAIGQVLLAQKLQKKKIDYSVSDESHAIATALLCSKLNISLKTFIKPGTLSEKTRGLLSALGSELVDMSEMPFPSSNQMYAFQDWMLNKEEIYLLFDEAIGPTPFPVIIRSLFALYGEEIKSLYLKKFQKAPDLIVAHLDQASSALGLFYPFLKENTELVLLENNEKETKTTTVFMGAISVVRNMNLDNQKIVPPELTHLIDINRVKNIKVDSEIADLPLTLQEKGGIIFSDACSYINLDYVMKMCGKNKSIIVLTKKGGW